MLFKHLLNKNIGFCFDLIAIEAAVTYLFLD